MKILRYITKLSALLLVYFLGATTQGLSQEENPFLEIRQKLDVCFSDFERKAVPTGILSDYSVFEPVPLAAYDGVLRDSNFVDLSSQALLYTALSTAIFDRTKETKVDYKSYLIRSKSAQKESLSLLLYRYNYIPKALAKEHFTLGSQNKLEFKSQLRSQQQQPLYSERLVVAMAPKQVLWDNLSVQYHFPNDAIYSNLQEEIASYAVQYDKGLPFTPFAPGGTLKHTYASEGVKHLVFRITLKDGQQLYSQTHILVHPPTLSLKSSALGAKFEPHAIVPIPASPLGTAGRNRGHAGGRILIRYASNDQVIRKPLIIAEGYDPSSLFPEKNFLLKDFINMFTEASETESRSLPPSLEATFEGFDLIYLDYNDGMDHISYNADLMKEVIRWVNDKKKGAEENIVLGYSMGGLVAAIALREMEIAGEGHQTWKYISLDAPHLGASVPYGMLEMTHHILSERRLTNLLKIALAVTGDSNDSALPENFSLRKMQMMLEKPATQQLLINNLERYKDYHASFFQAYHELGLPQKTVNVAFSNGSMSGTQLFHQGSSIVKANAQVKGGLPIAWLIRAMVLAFDLHDGALLSDLNYSNILNLTPSTIVLHLNMEVNALSRTSKPPYHFDLGYTDYLLDWIPVRKFRMRYTASRPKEAACIEDAAGGYFPLDDLPESNGWKYLNSGSQFVDWITGFVFADAGYSYTKETDKIAFVPRNSALYLKNGVESAAHKSLDADMLLKNGTTSFDRIYGVVGDSSRSHMDMSAHNKAFDLELKEYPAPARIPLSIVGPRAFKDSAVYYIPEMHKGVHYSISSGPETLCEELGGGHKIRVTPRTDGDPSMIGRKTWVGCTAKKICSPDSTERTFRMPVYMGTPHPDDIEIKQLSMSFGMGDAPVQSTLLPAVIVLWKGAGELLDAQFQNSDRVSEIGIINSISAFAQEGYVDTLSLNGEGLALIGAYNVDPSDLSLRNNTRFMSGQEGEGSNTDLDISTGGEHPANPSNPSRPHPAELELAPPEVLPIFPPRDLEYLNVHSFYLFAPLPALVGTPTAGTAPPETINLRVKLTNQAGKGDWTKPFAFQVPKELIFLTRPLPEATPHPGGDLRPILVPSVLQDGLGTLRATSSDASSPNVWEGIKVKVELFSDTERVFSTEAMTNETVNLSALERGNYTVLFTVGTQRFSQTISIR